jgi:hypothetical protein
MKYYIPISDGYYLCIENGKKARIVRGEPDPFSRVTRPPIRWELVQSDLPHLTKRALTYAKRSTIAYTRLWKEPC